MQDLGLVDAPSTQPMPQEQGEQGKADDPGDGEATSKKPAAGKLMVMAKQPTMKKPSGVAQDAINILKRPAAASAQIDDSGSRDKVKARKFEMIFDSLPQCVKDAYDEAWHVLCIT